MTPRLMIKSEDVAVNFTSIVNHTEKIDLFCNSMLAGPLVWGAFSLPISLVGVFASLWLLWVLVQRKRSGLSNDIYILNLTIMDLIFDISVPPYIFSYFFWQSYVHFKMSDFFYCLNVSGRPLFMACICVDCYMAVVFPVSNMNLKHSQHRLVVCVLVWVITLSSGIINVFDFYIDYPILSVTPFILSLPIITFCDLSILYNLRKPDPSGRSDVHPQKQRALQAITNSFIVSVVSYLPQTVTYGLSPLLPLSSQEAFCFIGYPFSIGSALGSAIMSLLHLGNLGSLKLKKCGCIKRV